MTDELLTEANGVLACLSPDLEFRLEKGRLRLDKTGDRLESHRILIRSGDGLWPTSSWGDLGCGGTWTTLIVQLVRWMRGQTRRPVSFWRYAFEGEDRAVVVALRNSTYNDASKTSCILCGRPDPSDWWSMPAGKSGPCCLYGRCLKETP